MKIASLCFIGSILLAIVGLVFLILKIKLDTQNILTAILVLITAIYAGITFWSVRVSEKMAKQMLLSNRINYRPYVVVESLPKERLTALMMQSGSTNPFMERGLTIMLMPETMEEIFMYSTVNIGNVPAHNIKFEHNFQEVEEKAGQVVKEIKVDDKTESIVKDCLIKDCLFPGKEGIRSVSVGKNVFFRNDIENKFIRIRLKITYEGIKDIDTSRYFTIYQWRWKPAKSVEEMNAQGVGNIGIEIIDEGIEKQK